MLWIRDYAIAVASVSMLMICPGPAIAGDDDYLQQLPAQRRARCEAIPSNRYWTGLIFNPENLETGYERSRCFQELAGELRDRRLCQLARERESWFFDGSGISQEACNATVAAQIRQDKEQARRMHAPQKIVGLAVDRNGNGHDVDVRIQTSGGSAATYWLELSVIDAYGIARIVHQGWQSMDSADAELVIFVRRQPMLSMHEPDRALILNAMLELRPRNLDELARYSHLPAGSQKSILQQPFVPSALERAPLTPIP